MTLFLKLFEEFVRALRELAEKHGLLQQFRCNNASQFQFFWNSQKDNITDGFCPFFAVVDKDQFSKK
jgi:hypothetical protein